MAELDYQIERVEALGEKTVRDMFALYRRFFDKTDEQLFRGDLENKQYVVVLRDQQNEVRGFSTVAVTEHLFEGKRVRAFYSGDTIVDNQYWGQQALQTAWFRLAASVKAAAPDVPLYWFLLVKGHRTYRILRAFFQMFFPARDHATPQWERALTDMLARQRFGEAYDADRGVVSFPESRGQLKTSYAEVPEKHRKRPDVLFFLERNPGYVNGDELVCLCELTSGNMRSIGKRLFQDDMQIAV